MKKKKECGAILQILFLLFVVAGVTIMYNNPHYGEGIGWLTDEAYEDTQDFTGQFKRDIIDIFHYIRYKEVFETGGKLDYSREILKVTDGPGETRSYTVDDMVRIAKSYGLYLDEAFKVSGRQGSSQKETADIRVDWRAYDPDRQYSEPGEAYCTQYELACEVLGQLGNYYAFHYKFIQNPSNFKFRVCFKDSATQLLYTNTAKTLESEAELEHFKSLGPYVYIAGDSLYIDSNLGSASMLKGISAQLEQSNPYNNGDYYLIAAIDSTYPFQDSYALANQAYEHSRFIFITGIILFIIGSIGCLVTLYYLACLTGRTDSKPDMVTLGRIDAIPVETCILLFGLIYVAALFFEKYIIYKFIHLFWGEDHWFYGELVVRMVSLYLIGILAGFSLIRRYKAGTLRTNSLMKRAGDIISIYFRNRRFTTRLMACYLLFLFYNIFILMAVFYLFFQFDAAESRVFMGLLLIFMATADLWVFHQMYRNAWQTDQINDAVVKISEGNTTFKIDTTYFQGKEKVLAENINHISSGLEMALHEKVRSERLKADLITNVSHDIKTPLTSIINYVDLIKREQIDNPKIQGYLNVLEQKSQRLKTLTEDLVEASKVSSGNIKLEMADIDFVELIWQTNGEFEEKFSIRHLELISTLPEEAILIRADGRHLWRVLENLYNNTFKYAMEHSRVYIDIVKSDGKVVFTIKNISENPLNISAEELTERFVRGDVARATEGSGLGLSIAKSLTELQGGEFTIYIDGDLFKVAVAFPLQTGSFP